MAKKPSRSRRTSAVTPGIAEANTPDGPLLIVGVGASAGGLEAFAEFLEHLAPDTGCAFVLVQHLDPDHQSILASLLQRKTALPVHAVTNNLRVERNHVYVIPPNTYLGIVSGVLTLEPRDDRRSLSRSVDVFFEALAADRHHQAIGVVLSGAASDGTMGLEAIKAEGGITFAQDQSAAFDSMPRSAITAGCVDFVLPPRAIAHELARIARHPALLAGEPASIRGEQRESAAIQENGRTPPPSTGRQRTTTPVRVRGQKRREDRTTPADTVADSFRQILQLLRNHSGVDFSRYKSSTIERRVSRRMVLSRHQTLEEYARFLRNNAKELDALYSDALISVTTFFRNPDAFDVLQSKVWPAILQQRSDDPVRVWVLGCSTGQEAYSIAMSYLEAGDQAARTRRLQVFATDLNDALLDKARRGLYAKNLVQDLSPERLRRFFAEEEDGYRISKPLREMVIFARQNLIGDPPFSRMDLISCRNLLIYFEPDLQKKVFPTFHYALKSNGFLYLGHSESVSGFTDLFEPIDKKHKIYQRKAGPAVAPQLPARTASDITAKPLNGGDAGLEPGPAGFHGDANAQREADRVTVKQFAPPSVLINADLQVLQFRGATGGFLEAPSGKATFDVLKMARGGLLMPLRAAIAQARKTNKPARRDKVRIQHNGRTTTIGVEVIPLINLHERCFLVVFEDARQRGVDRARPAPPRARRGSSAQRIGELESALAEAKEYLQSLQEEQEAAHEELQSSNEEVQSANEELQSLNEELETSKEELESSNEELTTFNEEMADRNAELGRVNAQLVKTQRLAEAARNYAEATIRTLRDPFVILDAALRIQSANDAFYQVFRTTAQEADMRSIYDISHGQWNVPQFRRLLEEVLPRNSFFNDFEMTHHLGALGPRTMLVSARRVHDDDTSAARILLSIQDVTEVLQFQIAARRIEARYRALVEATTQIVWTTDAAGAVIDDSPSWREFTGQSYDELKAWGWLNAIHPDDRQRVHEFWLRTVQLRQPSGTEYRLRRVSGDWRWVEARIVPVHNQDGSVREWVASNTDISERRSHNDALHEADRQKNVFLAMLAHELRNPLAPIRNAIEIIRRSLAVPPGTPERDTTLTPIIAMMERQVGHMASLVDDLLDVSRISRGKITLRRERINLTQVLRHAIDTVLPLMEAKRVELKLAVPADPVFVNADSHRVAQIVGNLLNNAWKFTAAGGGVDVALETQGRPPETPYAEIRVKDSGIGVAADQLPRIFEMFQQVDQSLDRASGGLGIGLTLAKTLTEMHGGTVEAVSAGLGHGTEILVRLPALAD